MKTKVAYWICTALVALTFALGGVFQIIGEPGAVEGIIHLGYPPYFVPMLGVWKLLGAAVLLAPRLPLVKEWAYAGMIFDMTSASISHAAVGDPIGNVVAPIVIAALVVASWWLRPAERRLTLRT